MITLLELFIAVVKKVKKMSPEKLGYIIRYEYDLYFGGVKNKSTYIHLLILLDSEEEGG